MEKTVLKRIGVLTSGGDAPGMNAAIRAVVRAGLQKNMEVVGIQRGYHGLLNKDVYEMSLRSVTDIISRGGTMLHTARSTEFATPEGVARAAANCRELGIEGIVVIGGDGSFRGARDLSLAGVPCVGVPGTIDNDIGASEYTIGFDTATSTAMELVDKIRDTTVAHERCHVVEVMGRKAGYIALEVGIACGAFAIIVPEVEINIERDIIGRIREAMATGKRHFIIVIAEGAGHAQELSAIIQKETGVDSRPTTLGYVQRGGSPTARDRMMASIMGHHALNLLAQGIGNRVVVVQNGKIKNLDIYEALAMKKPFTLDIYQAAQDISI